MGVLSLSNIRKAITNPGLIRKLPDLLYRDGSQMAVHINRHYYQRRYGWPTTDFMAADWDNLLIIDAARPDILREVINDSVQMDTRQSPATYSGGFISKTFRGELHDTVYVTANPHVKDVPDDVFHAVINLLETDWDEQERTVHPEPVVQRAIEAYEKYPNKRLVVHFMQPHFPFIGQRGTTITDGLADNLGDGTVDHPWNDMMYHRRYDREMLIEAYRENHEIAYEHASRLHREIGGKSVITADHANLIGERGVPIPIPLYGHPIAFPHPNLTRVPWIELAGERRKTKPDPPEDRERMSKQTVDDRLEALGYR